MKQILLLSFWCLAIFALVLISGDVMAQPPGMPGAPTQAPIDGGLSILALSGGAYALKKFRDNKKG